MGDTEKAAWLEAADVLSLPSAHESFGLAVAEGWSFGVPAVTSDIAPLRSWSSRSAGASRSSGRRRPRPRRSARCSPTRPAPGRWGRPGSRTGATGSRPRRRRRERSRSTGSWSTRRWRHESPTPGARRAVVRARAQAAFVRFATRSGGRAATRRHAGAVAQRLRRRGARRQRATTGPLRDLLQPPVRDAAGRGRRTCSRSWTRAPTSATRRCGSSASTQGAGSRRSSRCPTHVAQIEKHLTGNGLRERVELVAAAAATGDGTAVFQDAGPETRPSEDGEGVEVALVDWFERLPEGPIDVLKMDIEGGEIPLLDDPRFAAVAARTQVFVLEWHKATSDAAAATGAWSRWSAPASPSPTAPSTTAPPGSSGAIETRRTAPHSARPPARDARARASSDGRIPRARAGARERPAGRLIARACASGVRGADAPPPASGDELGQRRDVARHDRRARRPCLQQHQPEHLGGGRQAEQVAPRPATPTARGPRPHRRRARSARRRPAAARARRTRTWRPTLARRPRAGSRRPCARSGRPGRPRAGRRCRGGRAAPSGSSPSGGVLAEEPDDLDPRVRHAERAVGRPRRRPASRRPVRAAVGPRRGGVVVPCARMRERAHDGPGCPGAARRRRPRRRSRTRRRRGRARHRRTSRASGGAAIRANAAPIRSCARPCSEARRRRAEDCSISGATATRRAGESVNGRTGTGPSVNGANGALRTASRIGRLMTAVDPLGDDADVVTLGHQLVDALEERLDPAAGRATCGG